MNAASAAPIDYPLTIRGAADQAFIGHVQALMAANQDKFRPNKVDPERRKFWMMDDFSDLVIEEKKLELIERYGITGWTMEGLDPDLQDLIGWIAEGGSVHPHTDPTQKDRLHVRINLLVAEPEGGCVPHLAGIPIDIGLGDAWLCLSSHCRHSTTPVIGASPRSIVSYGMLVSSTGIAHCLEHFLKWRLVNMIAE